MKRFAVILAVFAMLSSLLAFGVSAESTCQEVTIPKFTAKPSFDGVISVEEWGEPTVHVVTDGAATADDDTIGVNEEYGLINTFYWFLFEDKEMSENFYYDLWMRWDEEFFYIAAKVNDPDPFSQVDTWNGDTFQFILDVKGPSAKMLNKDPEFDYKTDPFLGTYKTPWSSDAAFATVVSLVKGESPLLWRAKGDWNIVNEAGGMVGITTTDNGDGMTCTNVFEVAVPWSVIAADGINVDALNPDFVPKAGDVYGITAVVCCTDSNVTNGWLQWGHGICYVSADNIQPRGTRGGSQAMILGTDEVTPAAEYEIATETTEPETEITTDPPADTSVADGTDAPADETDGTAATTTKTPTEFGKGDDRLPTVAIIAVIAGALVVVVVVVIVIKKKK